MQQLQSLTHRSSSDSVRGHAFQADRRRFSCQRTSSAVGPAKLRCGGSSTNGRRTYQTGAVAEPAAATVSQVVQPSDAAPLPNGLAQPQGAQGPASVWAPPVGRAGLYDSEGRLVLKSLTLPELEAWCAAEGESAPANRALQIWRWMYADPPAGAWVRSMEETLGRQNGFSAKFLEKVGRRVSLDGGLQLHEVVRAADGTRKLVFRVTGGEAAGGTVETVLIPIVRQHGLRDRLTICVSSQVGCAMNCQFCYTGRMGLLGNLSTAQIVEQVVEARRFLAEEGDRTQLTNLVFMGMGEPLHNTESVLAAAEVISHYLGLHISHNKMTISTVGLVPEMRQVAARSRAQIALSLHATTDEVRDWIVPVNRRYDLATLVTALEELFPKSPSPPSPAQAPASPEAPPHGQEVAGQGLSAQATGPASTLAAADTPSTQTAGALARKEHLQESGPRSQSHPVDQSDEAERLAAGGEEGRWLPPLGASLPVAPASGPQSTASSHADAVSVDGGSCSASGSGTWSAADEGEVSGDEGDRSARSGPSGAASTSSSSSVSSGVKRGSGRGGGGGGGGGGAAGGRSLLVEYTMLHGINDTLEDAERLIGLLSRINCKVNLIVFNPHAGTRFQPSRPETVSAFRSLLVQRGMVCTIRDSRGDDEMAACGQLGNVGLAFRPSPILEAPERFRPFLLTPSPPARPAQQPGTAQPQLQVA